MGKTSGNRAVTGQSCGVELTALNANKVLGELPDMTSWAVIFLMGHRSEIAGDKLSKEEDSRLGTKCGLC